MPRIGGARWSKKAMFPVGNDGIEARNVERAAASSANVVYHVRLPTTISLPTHHSSFALDAAVVSCPNVITMIDR